MDLFYYANDLKPRNEQIKLNEFYNDPINEIIDIKNDFFKWHKSVEKYTLKEVMKNRRKYFALTSYPWILDPTSKTYILRLEASLKQ